MFQNIKSISYLSYLSSVTLVKAPNHMHGASEYVQDESKKKVSLILLVISKRNELSLTSELLQIKLSMVTVGLMSEVHTLD